MILADFTSRQVKATPFPHVRAVHALPEALASNVLDWLDADAPWSLTEASFYEQQEFSLLSADLPEAVEPLTSCALVASIARELGASLSSGPLELVDVNAHRLLSGMTIRLHNDFLGTAEESHRMLIQLNRGWSQEQGGLLMLFEEDRPESVADMVLPVHRSAFGFEISECSHHAVSTVHNGVRDTIVYTFKKT
ncbi:MAG: cyclophane-containing peptide 2OG-Fe(II) oxygenase YhhC [Allosphingosinicella sp.]